MNIFRTTFIAVSLLLTYTITSADGLDWNSSLTEIINGTVIAQTDTINVRVGWMKLNHQSSIQFEYNGAFTTIHTTITDSRPIVEFKHDKLSVTYSNTPIGRYEERKSVELYVWDFRKKQLIEYSDEHESFPSHFLENRVRAILPWIKEKRIDQLTAFIDSTNGLHFSPYGNEALRPVTLNKSELINFNSIDSVYNWGVYDGIGTSILLKPKEYYSRFIYDFDFLTYGKIFSITNDSLIRAHSLSSVYKKYKNCKLVVSHYPGTASTGYKDFRTLVFGFIKKNNEWYLVAIVHS